MWNITQKVTQFAYHPKCHKTRQDSITYFISLLLIRCLRQFCLWIGKGWCHGPVRYPLIRLKKMVKACWTKVLGCLSTHVNLFVKCMLHASQNYISNQT